MLKHFLFMATAFLFCAAPAQAGFIERDIRFDFSATNFQDEDFGTVPPENTLTGSITINAYNLNESMGHVTHVDLVIGGHRYTTAEVSWYFGSDTFYFEGRSAGWQDSFYLPLQNYLLDGVPALSGWMQYSSPGTGIFMSYEAEGTATKLAAAVPEPETYAMLLAGLCLIGFTARRRAGATRA